MTGPDTQNSALFAEIHELVTACLEDIATAEQSERLDRLIHGNAEARRLYVQYLGDSIGLRYTVATPCEPGILNAGHAAAFESDPSAGLSAKIFFDSPSGSPSLNAYHGAAGYFSAGWPVAYLIATVVVGIGLVIGTLVHVSQPGDHAAPHDYVCTPDSQSPLPNPTTIVARITGMVDCVWEETGFGVQGSGAANQRSEIINHKSPLHLGDRLALRSGLLEITYDTGAKVILQGPVSYEVESPAGGYLSVGKLAARLEKKREARGEMRGEGEKGVDDQAQDALTLALSRRERGPAFVVRTPTALVTDLGTEFGVEVDKSGSSDVHVFVGAVRLSSANHPGDAGMATTLTTGESARADQATVARCSPAQRTKFVRRIPNGHVQAYRKAVLADGPLFYWTFDELAGSAFEQVRHLANQRLDPLGDAERCTHAAIGSGLALGRAADFRHAAGCFRSPVMEAGHMPGAWAIEFWVQVTGEPDRAKNQCMMTTGEGTRHGLRNPAVMSVARAGGTECELELFAIDARTGEGPRIADNRWHHVLLVFFGNAKGFGVADRVDIVVDGQSQTVARGEFSSGLNMEGRLAVGAAGADLSDSLQGRIDELAFYDLNGLTVAEIASKVARMASEHRAAARSSHEIANEDDTPGEEQGR